MLPVLCRVKETLLGLLPEHNVPCMRGASGYVEDFDPLVLNDGVDDELCALARHCHQLR